MIRCELILKCENVQGKSKWDFGFRDEIKTLKRLYGSEFHHILSHVETSSKHEMSEKSCGFSLVNRAC